MIVKAEGCSPGRRKAVHREGGRLFTGKVEGCSPGRRKAVHREGGRLFTGKAEGSCLMSGGDLEKKNFFQVVGSNP